MSDTRYQVEPWLMWLVLFGLCVGMFAVAFNTTALMNALVSISNSLSLTPVSLQWAVNAYLLACASCIVLGGQLGDMYGRRKIISLGCLGFIFSSCMIAMSHSATVLIIGRGLQGLSAAILTPGTLAMIKFAFPEDKQTSAIGIWTAAIGLGFAIGPVLSGVFVHWLSWRYIFWLNIPLAAIALFIVYIFGNHFSGTTQNIKLDWWGLLLLVCGLVPIVLALVEGNIWGWASTLTIFLLIAGVLILIAFWVIESMVKSPLVQFTHFHHRIFVAGSIDMGASIFSLIIILYFFNTFAQNPLLLNYTPLLAGYALLPVSISMFVFSLCNKWIVGHFGFRWPITFALLLSATGFFLLSRITIPIHYSELVLPLILIGVGVGISFSGSPTLGMSALSAEKAGEGSGIINTINYLGGVLGTSIGTLFAIIYGRRALDMALAKIHLAHPLPLKLIDNAAFGERTSLRALFSKVAPVDKAHIVQALQQSSLHSFTAVALMAMCVALAAAVLSIILIRSKPE